MPLLQQEKGRLQEGREMPSATLGDHPSSIPGSACLQGADGRRFHKVRHFGFCFGAQACEIGACVCIRGHNLCLLLGSCMTCVCIADVILCLLLGSCMTCVCIGSADVILCLLLGSCMTCVCSRLRR